METAPLLTPLGQNDTELSDLLDNVAENYGKYHELSLKYTAWQNWYKKQKEIFNELNNSKIKK